MEIYSVTFDELGEAWQEVVGHRKLRNCVVCETFPDDALIVLMAFGGKDNELPKAFEVGEGASIRPYICHYKGRSAVKASKVWFATVGWIIGLSAK